MGLYGTWHDIPIRGLTLPPGNGAAVTITIADHTDLTFDSAEDYEVIVMQGPVCVDNKTAAAFDIFRTTDEPTVYDKCDLRIVPRGLRLGSAS